jgi:hypothetical protein
VTSKQPITCVIAPSCVGSEAEGSAALDQALRNILAPTMRNLSEAKSGDSNLSWQDVVSALKKNRDLTLNRAKRVQREDVISKLSTEGLKAGKARGIAQENRKVSQQFRMVDQAL